MIAFRQPMRLLWAIALSLCLATQAFACRHALVLALDVSGSVDAIEYQQQVSGLAFALRDSAIQDIILANTEQPVLLAVFEWSSQNHQYLILPWTELSSSTALESAITRIERHTKVRAGLKTALGTALLFGQRMLEQYPSCWQHTIDVSADGRNNSGLSAQSAYAKGFGRTTVNALVVGNPEAASGEGPGIEPSTLLRYFETDVIRGAASFAMIADGYEDYARAMKEKLERELQSLVIGQNGAEDRHSKRLADN